ncbi:MAG TPA: protein phosphatase 2C domain-containing protein [Bryobacteraceae bacterium]|nr:protein phosphatase 2C domain-containing protein [Bryobacteraceae bacterium]
MLEVEFAQLSDAGRVRSHNEDYLGFVRPSSAAEARTHGWLFVLADGVGGQDSGEVASRVAVETVLAGFRAAPAGELLPGLLTRLVQAANARVLDAGLAAAPGGVNMATTIVACALRFDRAAVAHAGDSRCYLIRRGNVTILTRDHTVANEQARMGVLSAREAASVDTRHLLTRSLGSGIAVNVDVSEHPVTPADLLVLCSDGLHGAVETADFGLMLTPGRDLERAVRDLVHLANQKDGGDNISVQAIRVRSVERIGMYRGRPYKLR